MIISVRLKNFYSIREEAVIDFTADMTSKKKSEELTENLIEYSGDKFVNIIGLFGSNAAGKSNIIKALAFCRDLVLTSHLHNEDDLLNFEPFKFDKDKPSEFHINFVTEGIEYEYAFHIYQGKICFEELYYYPKKRRAKVFSREDCSSYSYRKGIVERPKEIEVNTGSKNLFISRASSMNRSIAQTVYRFFKNEIVVGVDLLDFSKLNRQEFDECKDILLKALEVSDSDIVDIRLSELKPGIKQLYSFHKENPDIPFDFEKEESDGTKRLFIILMMLLRKTLDGASIFVDELDLKLHVRLTEFLLDLVRASSGAQLVFTSHNPSLIDTSKLRPEQIVFVNKQADGNSEFVPLSDYEAIDKKMDIQKAYLQGRFDAVPYIGNIYPLLADLINK